MKFLKSFILLFLLFFAVKTVHAKTEILHQGTGNYEITLYNDSKISDIENILGSPKLTTASAFGGSAYSFYTDDYNNFLYVETLNDGTIASYITFQEGYETPSYSYGDSYPYSGGSVLSGYLLNDGGSVIGGAYYNRYLENISSSELLKIYNNNFSKSDGYKKGLSKHAVLIFNALQAQDGKTARITFDDAIYDLAASYEKNGGDLRTVINETNERWAFGLQENIRYNGSSLYTMNPLFLARFGTNNTAKSEYPIAIFYYDETKSMVWAFSITQALKEKITEGNLGLTLLNKDDLLVEQNILYLTESLSKDLSEQEIISKISQFSQDGNLYQRNSNDQNYYGVLVDHGGVCAGYSDTLKYLSNINGVFCTTITSPTQNHAFNLCYTSDEWSYYDNQKKLTTPLNAATAYSQLDALAFKNLTYMKSMGYIFDSYAWDKGSTLEAFPEGVTKDFSSKMHVYYDETYTYYIKNVYEKNNGDYEWHSYIIREDRAKGVEKVLAETPYYTRSSIGLVKDKDILYYVDLNYNLSSMDTNGQNKKSLVSRSKNKKIQAVFTREGSLYYSLLNDTTKEAEIIKYQELSGWPELKLYTLDHTKYAYDLAYLEGENSISIIKAIGLNNELPKGRIYIPETINDKPVVGIGDSAFDASSNTQAFTGEITLPKYLKYIGKSAFAHNEKITKINFNDSLVSIGQSAFYKMSGLKGAITIPDSVKTISDLAFAYTTNIEEFSFGENVKMITRSILEGAINLKKVTLGNKVVAIGSDAFTDCVNLSSITIPSTTTHIYSDAFTNTENLKTIILQAKNIESMNFLDTAADIYLHGSSKTGVYAKTNDIAFIDLDHLEGKITLSKEKLTVDLGSEPIALTYKVTPSVYELDYYTWSSDNESVAKVDEEGIVTFTGVGSTMIRLTGDNGLSVSLVVTVNRVNITDFYLSQSTIWLSPGETKQLESLILPEEVASTQTINWYTNDSTIASVSSSGLVTAKEKGTTTITARLTTGLEKEITVEVKDTYVPRSVIKKEYLPGEIASEYHVKNNLNESETVMNLTSTNPSVAKIRDNKLQIVGGGLTILKGTAKTSDVYQVLYVAYPVTRNDGTTQYVGDMDNNSVFDLEDFKLLKEKIGSTNYNDLLIGDLTGDKKIDEEDLQLFAEIILNHTLTLDVDYPDITIKSVFPRTFLSYDAADDVHFKKTTLTVSYENTTGFYDIPVTWESSNPEVASVNNVGEVTYHKEGETIITAKLDEEHTDSIHFYLTDETMSFEKNVYRVKVGSTITPKVTAPYTNRTNSSVTTYSKDPTIASYKNNQITGLKPGTTTITYHMDNYAVTSIVIVEEEKEEVVEEKPITSVYFKETELSLLENEVYYVTPEFNPYDTTMDTTLSFVSSNEKVATITNDGKITAIKEGSTTITASTANGKTATITVTVKKKKKPIEDINVTPMNVTLKIGETKQITTTFVPEDTTEDKTLTYQSNNESIASVSKDGLISAHQKGTTSITVTTKTGIKKEITVTVLGQEENYLLGDMNYSGKIELADFILGLRYYLGTYNNGEGMMDVYDMNGNGKKELGDAILILREYLY